jgi:hypothetical protein
MLYRHCVRVNFVAAVPRWSGNGTKNTKKGIFERWIGLSWLTVVHDYAIRWGVAAGLTLCFRNGINCVLQPRIWFVA